MSRLLASAALFSFLLAACTPLPVGPAATPTAEPTIAPPTPTPAAALVLMTVDGSPVPDPRLSNPEFFALSDENSVISEFAQALEADPEALESALAAQVRQGTHGSFVLMQTADGFPVLMARRDEGNEWAWERAGLSNLYMEITGKHFGLHVSGNEMTDPRLSEQTRAYFAHGGIVSTKDQIPEWADMMGAEKPFQLTADNDMSLMLYKVMRSNGFRGLNVSNVEPWLNVHIGHATEFTGKGTGRPTYLVFDRLLDDGSDALSTSFNPLRDKYGDRWFAKYLAITLKVFLKKDFVPNQDFYLMVNETGLYGDPGRAGFLVRVLEQARMGAIQELSTDPETGPILKQMNINDPAQLRIAVGVRTHVNLDGTIEQDREAPPTPQEVNELAEQLKPVGPLLLTEVDPLRGSDVEKEQFIAGLVQGVTSDNAIGLVLWSVYFAPMGTQDTAGLFSHQGYPTRTCLELMKTMAGMAK